MKSRLLCLRFEKTKDDRFYAKFDVFHEDENLAHEWTYFDLSDESINTIHTKDNDRAKIFFAKLEAIYDVFEMNFDKDIDDYIDQAKQGIIVKKIIHLDGQEEA